MPAGSGAMGTGASLRVEGRFCETPKLPKYGLGGLEVKRGEGTSVETSSPSLLMPRGFVAKKTSSTF